MAPMRCRHPSRCQHPSPARRAAGPRWLNIVAEGGVAVARDAMAISLRSVDPAIDPLDGMSLPGWLYYDPEFFEAEKSAFLRTAPQVVCHESEIAKPGEWRSLEYLGESVIVIRGDDHEVRAFSNV